MRNGSTKRACSNSVAKASQCYFLFICLFFVWNFLVWPVKSAGFKILCRSSICRAMGVILTEVYVICDAIPWTLFLDFSKVH